MPVDSPLITAVIPTYRRPQLLKRAILSILRQTYENIQVCVYDNASGDETESVVRELIQGDSRVKYYCHSVNIGAAANISYGISQVSTPLFSLLSDDDVMLPTFYQEMVENFERFPEAMFSAGSVIIMTPTGQVIDAPLFFWKRDGYFSPPEGLFELIGGRHPILIGILFRKESVDIFHGMDPKMIASDLDFELRIAARFPFVVSKKPCGIFMYHPSSAGAQADTSYIWPDCLKIIRNLTDDEQVPVLVRERVEQTLNVFFRNKIFTLGLRSALRGNFADAHKAAYVLRSHYKSFWKYLEIEYATRIVERSKLISKLAVVGFNSARYLSQKSHRSLQKHFGYLSKFLEM